MKKINYLLGLLVLFNLNSCSENVIDDLEKDKTLISSKEELNKTFPDGYPIMGVDKTIGTELKTTYPSAYAISVPRKVQEKIYYCGPACLQMINYYYDMPVSQTTIANFCKTDASGTMVYRMVNWLNKDPMTGKDRLPSGWVWEYHILDSYNDFLAKLQWSVGGHSAPQIWRLQTCPGGIYHLPGYTKNMNHYITGSGYILSNSKVLYDDPWYGDGGGSDIWADANTVYYCIKIHGGYIIY
jgi:hypothetical protein